VEAVHCEVHQGRAAIVDPAHSQGAKYRALHPDRGVRIDEALHLRRNGRCVPTTARNALCIDRDGAHE
jgi:hypothetical protein